MQSVLAAVIAYASSGGHCRSPLPYSATAWPFNGFGEPWQRLGFILTRTAWIFLPSIFLPRIPDSLGAGRKIDGKISEIISTSSFCYQSFFQVEFGFHRFTLARRQRQADQETSFAKRPTVGSLPCQPPILRLIFFHSQDPAPTRKCTWLNLVSQESSGNHMEFLPIMSPLGGYSRSPYDMPAAPVA